VIAGTVSIFYQPGCGKSFHLRQSKGSQKVVMETFAEILMNNICSLSIDETDSKFYFVIDRNKSIAFNRSLLLIYQIMFIIFRRNQ
jgi:hypothetical protein